MSKEVVDQLFRDAIERVAQNEIDHAPELPAAAAVRFLVEVSHPSYGAGAWFPCHTGGVPHVSTTAKEAYDRRDYLNLRAFLSTYRMIETTETDAAIAGRMLTALEDRLAEINAGPLEYPARTPIACPTCQGPLTLDRVTEGSTNRTVVAALCSGCEFLIVVAR